MITEKPNNTTELGDRAYGLAYRYEQDYRNCPQCVFAALQDTLGIGDDIIFQAAYTLGGGGASTTCGTCGALSAGLLAIGSVFGRDRQHFDAGSYDACKLMAKRLWDRFIEEFGSPICKDVHVKVLGRHYDLWTEMEEFDAAGGHQDKCPTVTGRVARWTAELLKEEMG